MTKKKRRMFEIDMPEEIAAPVPAPAPPSTGPRIRNLGDAPRRGPMATAISESADALSDRAAAEAAIRAENDALAHELVRLKKLGLITDLVPLEKISTAKLIRDRSRVGEDLELGELKASILDVGLSNPIRVEADGQGAYELIQGFRRLSAYRELLAETGDDRWATIPAGMVSPGESVESLYRRMVDENLVRKGVSFAEMAMLADAYAADPSTGCNSPEDAVVILFRSASYQKRSYIRAFVELMVYIDKYLEFPQSISRNLGLSLRKRLEDTDGLTLALQRGLQSLGPNRTEAEELALLRQFAQSDEMLEDAPARKAVDAAAKKPKAARTVFRMRRPTGEAKCTASNGRLELRAPEDFTVYDPKRLSQALEAFYRALE